VRPVRSPVRAWSSYSGIACTLARRQTVPDRSRLDDPTTPFSSASTTAHTRKMRRLTSEQLGGVAELAGSARHPRSARQRHEPSKQAVQLTTATASGEPILGVISDAHVPVYPPRLTVPLSQSGSSANASPMGTARRSPTRRPCAGSRRSRLPVWTMKLRPPPRLHLDGVRVELAPALRVDLDPLDAALENAPLAVQREVRPQATNVLW
jgi:hypothetical protein